VLVRFVLHTLVIVDRGEAKWIYLVGDGYLGSWYLQWRVMDPDDDGQRIRRYRIFAVNRIRAFLVAA